MTIPNTISTGIMNHASPSGSWPIWCASVSDDVTTSGLTNQAKQGTHGDVAQRLGPQVRRKHIGGGDAELLRRVHAHAEHQHAADEHGGAAPAHRKPENDGAGERQHQSQQDAGLAAECVCDLPTG